MFLREAHAATRTCTIVLMSLGNKGISGVLNEKAHRDSRLPAGLLPVSLTAHSPETESESQKR
jgi:hypothetical protein